MSYCVLCGKEKVAHDFETCGYCAYEQGVQYTEKAYEAKLGKYRRYLELMKEDHMPGSGYDKALAYHNKIFEAKR